MAYQWVTHSKTFVPGEAYSLAASFKGTAQLIREHAARLRAIGSALDTSWEGNSQSSFSEAYKPEPGNTDDLAAWLDDTAAYMESLSVTDTWRTWDWVPDSEPEFGAEP